MRVELSQIEETLKRFREERFKHIPEDLVVQILRVEAAVGDDRLPARRRIAELVQRFAGR